MRITFALGVGAGRRDRETKTRRLIAITHGAARFGRSLDSLGPSAAKRKNPTYRRCCCGMWRASE